MSELKPRKRLRLRKRLVEEVFEDDDGDDDDDGDLDQLLEANEDEDAEYNEEQEALGPNPATRAVRVLPLDGFEADTMSVNPHLALNHIVRFWTRIEHIVHRYRSLARDEDLCRRICELPGRVYIDPFHPTRRWALARMTDEHQQQLVEIWRKTISERTQYVLESESFSQENMLSLPTGREKLPGRQTLREGTATTSA